MLNKPAKRFYETVRIEPSAGGFAVFLDDHTVNTPLGDALILPTSDLARVIAGEWDAQGKKIIPDTMPMMRLACTSIDKVRPNRDVVIGQMTDYGGNDLLCYRAEGPDDLVARQNERWNPLLTWAEITYGALLRTTSGIVHIEQTKETMSALRTATESHDEFELTALAEVTQLTGSLILGLAVSSGHIDWQTAFDAAQLDETWQNELWGEDFEAANRKKYHKLDLENANLYFSLVRAVER